MQTMSLTQPQIDRWLQGYELGRLLRERHSRRQGIQTPSWSTLPAAAREAAKAVMTA